MKISWQRAIDYYLGVPLCFLLGSRSRPAAVLPSPMRRILAIKFLGMGSIVLAMPALRKLKENFPGARITFLTFSENAEVLKAYPFVEEVWAIRSRHLLPFVIDVARTLFKVRRGFDLVLDLEFFSRFSSLLTSFTPAPMRLGFRFPRGYKGHPYTRSVPYEEKKHVIDYYGDMIRLVADFPEELNYCEPVASPAGEREASELLSQERVFPEDVLIALNVNAGPLALERRWPTESFLALCRQLEPWRIKVVLIGGKGDVGYVNDFISMLPAGFRERVVNTAGRLSVHGLMACLKRCAALVSNDSGPTHLSAALGVPTITLFGPETPVLYGPRGDKHMNFYLGLSCSPCMTAANAKKVHCPHPKNICLAWIHPRAVADALRKVLSGVPERVPAASTATEEEPFILSAEPRQCFCCGMSAPEMRQAA